MLLPWCHPQLLAGAAMLMPSCHADAPPHLLLRARPAAKAWGGVSGAAPAAAPVPAEVKIKPGEQTFDYEALKGEARGVCHRPSGMTCRQAWR